MYAKTSIAFLAVLLAPAGFTTTLAVPGQAPEAVSVSVGSAGPDGKTTIVVFPLSQPTGAAAIAGPVTITPNGENGSESQFELADGTEVDEKCSFDGTNQFCTMVVKNDIVTATTAFSTPLPSGFRPLGGIPPSNPGPGPSPSDEKKNGVFKAGVTASGMLVSAGLAAGLLL
ncbi:hypothetical protein BDW22DRAFT_256207 [Trametopsis cervina]|nr:hypothetical protein BDW22DRAFT_256207 [Trametopsis cervina]